MGWITNMMNMGKFSLWWYRRWYEEIYAGTWCISEIEWVDGRDFWFFCFSLGCRGSLMIWMGIDVYIRDDESHLDDSRLQFGWDNVEEILSK